MQLENGTIQLSNLSHVGIAVKDAEKAARFLSSVWNIGAPEVFDYEPKADEMIYGEPFKVRLVFIKFGPVPIELLQPLDNKSIWSKFIEEKGEGIHHIALGVSNYDEMVSAGAISTPVRVGCVSSSVKSTTSRSQQGGMPDCLYARVGSMSSPCCPPKKDGQSQTR